jgi:hypothetical protein
MNKEKLFNRKSAILLAAGTFAVAGCGSRNETKSTVTSSRPVPAATVPKASNEQANTQTSEQAGNNETQTILQLITENGDITTGFPPSNEGQKTVRDLIETYKHLLSYGSEDMMQVNNLTDSDLADALLSGNNAVKIWEQCTQAHGPYEREDAPTLSADSPIEPGTSVRVDIKQFEAQNPGLNPDGSKADGS